MPKIKASIYFFFNWLSFRVFSRGRFNRIPKINGRIYLRNSGTFLVGENVVINSSYSSNPIGGERSIVVIEKNATIEIGDNTGISNAALYAKSRITIASCVMLGGGVKIYDSDFHSIVLENRMKEIDDDISVEPVEIERGVFIGAGTYILKGVKIGEKSVVGAGSVVTKDIPPGQIWAGNPARYIRDV